MLNNYAHVLAMLGQVRNRKKEKAGLLPDRYEPDGQPPEEPPDPAPADGSDPETSNGAGNGGAGDGRKPEWGANLVPLVAGGRPITHT